MADISAYPFLTPDEFSEACHHLDRRYIQAPLGSLTRRNWKLRVCTALGTEFLASVECTTYIQITRGLEIEQDHGGLAELVGRWTMGGEEGEGGDEMIMVEEEVEDDNLAIRHTPSTTSPHRAKVVYEIHLHPTYRAPCLWFSLHGLPIDESPLSIDTIFRRLVPDQYKDGLRKVGSVGGISMAHHPVTGVPSFFVHPCLLGDAMLGFPCTREDYLMIWLGLVGGCVGLWVPKEMAMTPKS